jgi:hypothetical protein
MQLVIEMAVPDGAEEPPPFEEIPNLEDTSATTFL